MDLFDLVKTLFDWKAASERRNESRWNLARLSRIYLVSPLLRWIYSNTTERPGYRIS